MSVYYMQDTKHFSMQSVIYFHSDPVQEESLPFCILQMRKQKQRNHIGGGKIS